MYFLSDLVSAIRKPRSALAEINRILSQGTDFRHAPLADGRGVDIMSEDWDSLVILDACRFDTFRELASDLPGELEKVRSKASATDEFLRANFSDRELHDTVYVTANPQLYRIENGIYDVEPINVSFHEQMDVWQDHWHEEHRTVMPEVVTEAAIGAATRYPDKRLIVHYLQPHAPYVGKTGRKELPTEYLDFWRSFEDGKFDVSLDTARRAYRENLELVLPHVSELLSVLEGRTVVTADHGELLGERDAPIPIRRFGHPAHTDLPALVEVPWFVSESGTRREIVAEPPESREEGPDLDSDVVKDRLRDLGYTE